MRSLTNSEFQREFEELHHSIFARRELELGPFVSIDWRMVLIPYGYNMEESDIEALVRASQDCGDTDIIIADAETNNPVEAAVVVKASTDEFKAVKCRPQSNLGTVDVHIFGRSAEWGCVCAASRDDVAVLGGSVGFMDKYVDASGGAAFLRKRFLDFSSREWSIGMAARSHLLRLAGWEA